MAPIGFSPVRPPPRESRAIPSPRTPRLLETLLGFDWLAVLLVSWMLPLGFIPTMRVSYLNSLLFWIVPIACLLPRFLRATHPGSRRRRALAFATVQIVVLGMLLDLVFGHRILQFAPKEAGIYAGVYLHGVGMEIPIEELLFYLLAPPAMLLVYSWCDEYWLALYNPKDRRLAIPLGSGLVRGSLPLLGVAALLFFVGVAGKIHWSGGTAWLPFYYTFLLVTAFIPAAAFYRSIADLVNWRALSVTVLFVIATSVMWEITLAIPQHWWGYRPDGMVGKMILPWGPDPAWPFPVEAVFVWVCAPFATIFTYEAGKAYQYHPNRSGLRRMFGSPS